MKKPIVMVLLLLLTGMVVWLSSRPDSAQQEMPELVRFNPADVFSITLRQEAVGVISIKRSDEKWWLAEGLSDEGQQAADAKAVLHLLDDLASMEIVRVVTRSSDNYERLQLGLEKMGSTKTGSGSTQVTLRGEGGNTLLDLFVGKQGSDLISTYLRLADTPELGCEPSACMAGAALISSWKAVVSVRTDVVGEPSSEVK